MSDDGHEDHAELVMPFVVVASKGGPFDDDAYTAGYEMGLLDAALAAGGIAIGQRTLREENRAQADLIAMRHGYVAEFQHSDVEGWVYMRFTRPEADDTREGTT
ncbi:hypothetical protein [Pseudonocardia sp.]|uniref:hypothetical protein n=1 Tax=Pseudonocardia sp. TaxID=60912 RepID=UPI003D0C9A65